MEAGAHDIHGYWASLEWNGCDTVTGCHLNKPLWLSRFVGQEAARSKSRELVYKGERPLVTECNTHRIPQAELIEPSRSDIQAISDIDTAVRMHYISFIYQVAPNGLLTRARIGLNDYIHQPSWWRSSIMRLAIEAGKLQQIANAALFCFNLLEDINGVGRAQIPILRTI